jgi:beta-fructofuranosidase
MITQKRLILILFVLNSLVSSVGIYWSFNKNQLLTSEDSTIKFNHYGARELDIASGVIGNAIRTDGYSTYLSFEPDFEFSASAISGWFALESFPTDTAAFFGISNSAEETIAVCVDRYGKIMIGTGKNGTFRYISTNGKIDRFKWIFICLDNNPEGPQLYINGEKLIIEQAIPFSINNINTLQVGRDFRTKKVGIFDITLINGLIDEFRVHSLPLDSDYSKVEFEKYGNIIPELAIPSSRFANDFNRPKYHLLPSANWTNETHGLFYHNKRYHIFNQKNASNLFLGQINWGHFSSPDLINWVEHKPAITPEPGYDMNGIWSGHAVINDEGLPVYFIQQEVIKWVLVLSLQVMIKLTE